MPKVVLQRLNSEVSYLDCTPFFHSSPFSSWFVESLWQWAMTISTCLSWYVKKWAMERIIVQFDGRLARSHFYFQNKLAEYKFDVQTGRKDKFEELQYFIRSTIPTEHGGFCFSSFNTSKDRHTHWARKLGFLVRKKFWDTAWFCWVQSCAWAQLSNAGSMSDTLDYSSR